jgi:hypothetical protein
MPLSGLPRPLLASLYVRSRANSGAVRLKEADQLMGIALAPALQELGFPVLSLRMPGGYATSGTTWSGRGPH